MKICGKCDEKLDESLFGKDKSRDDGLQYWCRGCKSGYYQDNREETREKHRKYYEDNKSHIIQMNKDYRLADPDRTKRSRKADYHAHSDAYKARAKQWGKDNPEKVLEYRKKERDEHPEKFKARAAVQRAKSLGYLFPEPCEVCGSMKVDAHHHKGYAFEFWLDVQWLCKKHHTEAHSTL